jgi:hypothetical protein
MKLNKLSIIAMIALWFAATGCFKDLDTEPLDPDEVTSANVYDDPAAYRQVLAKLYAGYAVSGQQGPAGQSDISGIDEGFGQYLRGYWYHQELTTDEALVGWNDQTIRDFHGQSWTALDGFVYAFYSRIFYQVALVNEFLRETTDAKLNERGVDEPLRSEIKRFRAEARFLRALSYWHGLDLFRNTPFATENQQVGTFLPIQTNANDLFVYIENELKAIEADLADARTNEYARADKACAWMLLAKLYLNAEVYIGQNRYQDCLDQCDKILAAGYELDDEYQHVFMADNHTSPEVIFPIAYDGINTRTFGGTTYIIRAGIGGSMDPLDSGQDGGWGGNRTTKEFVAKFPADLTGIVVDFNPGQSANYPTIYVPATHLGFDTLANSTQIGGSAISSGSPGFRIYEGHMYFPNDNSEFYFAQFPNPNAPFYGDDNLDGILDLRGARIPVATAGLYYIRTDFNNSSMRTYTIEKRDWSIIGSATGNADLAMTYDEETNQLVYSGALTAGTFRFRANMNDATALGDANANGLLTTGAAAIQIQGDGRYEIRLDIDRPDFTYQIKSLDFDRRALFYTDGQTLSISDVTEFTEGYAIRKFVNITSTGQNGSNLEYPDTDFPMFRLGDVYLMAAEAILRGAGGGDVNQATTYVNKVRERAYKGASGNIQPSELDLNYLLDERARELYWECHRRTDLIRFGQFTDGAYVWEWKGNVQEGAPTSSHRNIFPIPVQDLNANSNLRQNPQY